MLIPLTRETFQELIPLVATGDQYAFYWGSIRDLLSRLLISVVGAFGMVLLHLIFGQAADAFLLTIGIPVGLYWIWGPILWASRQNFAYRQYSHCGFWQGRVQDIFITEELTGTEETVNKLGDLVIVENRERCLNLEIVDETGFSTQIQVPLKRNHRAIDVGDTAEMLVFSNRGDLSRIAKTSDIYIPDHNLWVSDYPCVQRDAFIEVSRRLNEEYQLPEADPLQRRVSGRKRTSRSTKPKDGFSPRESRSNRDDWEDYPEGNYRDRNYQNRNYQDYDDRDRNNRDWDRRGENRQNWDNLKLDGRESRRPSQRSPRRRSNPET
jgi:hypothetical protein